MGWLTKQMYSRGPGSPGKTCETVVKSFINYKKMGLDEYEACEQIICDYSNVYRQVGMPEITHFCDYMSTWADTNPALVSFIITLSSHYKKYNVLKQLFNDLDTLIEINNTILNKYNLNPEFNSKSDYEIIFKVFLEHPDMYLINESNK